MQTHKINIATCLALAVAGGAGSDQARAGFTSGTTGVGFPVNLLNGLDVAPFDGMIDAGKAPTAFQTQFIGQIITLFPFVNTADEAVSAAASMQVKIACAIDQVARRDPEIGACLKMLFDKGLLCVSFGMPNSIAGAAMHDGLAECNENDKLVVNARFLPMIATDFFGKPLAYDPAYVCVILTLLHEGHHALQDFRGDVSGLDDAQIAVLRRKITMCNESSDGTGGESRGAHVLENEWIAELKAELTKLRNNQPTDPAASDATKEVIQALESDFSGDEPGRNAAIDKLFNHLSAVERSNTKVIECYQIGKAALTAFLATEYTNQTEKNAALATLRTAMGDARWTQILSRFGNFRTYQFSHAGSGIIEQFNDNGDEVLLDTGLAGISDASQMFADGSGVTILVGDNGSGDPVFQVYSDANADAFIQSGELLFQSAPGVGASTDISFVDLSSVSAGVFVLDHGTDNLSPLVDFTFDGLPDDWGLSFGGPVDLGETGGFLSDEFLYDPNLGLAVGFQGSAADKASADRDHQVVGLPPQLFDLDPANDFVINGTEYDVKFYGPAQVGAWPVDGDTSLTFSAYYSNNPSVVNTYTIETVDKSTNQASEFLAFDVVSTRDPVTVPLFQFRSRSVATLRKGDWVRIGDASGAHTPIIVVGCRGVGADLTGDTLINGEDLASLLANWDGDNGCVDQNEDGVIDGADLAALLAAWTHNP